MSWSATTQLYAEPAAAPAALLDRAEPRSRAVEPPPNAARGIVLGLALAVPCWATIIALLVRFWPF